jgi:hypothetical protein
MTVFVNAGGADRTLSFPVDWNWLSGIPATLPSGSWGMLSLFCTDSLDSGIISAWSYESPPEGTRATIAEKTANYTITTDDSTIIADATAGSITITLPPAASAAEFKFDIKKKDSSANTVTIDADGAETIDGAATYVITIQYQSVTIQSDGTDWWVL